MVKMKLLFSQDKTHCIPSKHDTCVRNKDPYRCNTVIPT